MQKVAPFVAIFVSPMSQWMNTWAMLQPALFANPSSSILIT
ncbi:hypothetical protein [Metabacillus halosaccharovorans]|uniref:Uncharacterized protein n=1 Tax=Metabacillus halosaccharovorans TaxID=930124 RepID=A0ABT3DHP3_9BACI|nr:hypothetical protein [Metabacillus halosaccharovorans]MCV9886563.1 hypothetical protein [Metabacillus halosaccharovorans]